MLVVDRGLPTELIGEPTRRADSRSMVSFQVSSLKVPCPLSGEAKGYSIDESREESLSMFVVVATTCSVHDSVLCLRVLSSVCFPTRATTISCVCGLKSSAKLDFSL